MTFYNAGFFYGFAIHKSQGLMAMKTSGTGLPVPWELGQ